jgi:hypothetical protein
VDDIGEDRAEGMKDSALLTLRTSPGNYQAWFAVPDGPQERDKKAAAQFRKRVRTPQCGSGAGDLGRTQCLRPARRTFPRSLPRRPPKAASGDGVWRARSLLSLPDLR